MRTDSNSETGLLTGTFGTKVCWPYRFTRTELDCGMDLAR